MQKIGSLRTGQRFKESSTGRVFTLLAKEGNMVEVIHHHRKYAWPIQAEVIAL